MARCKKKLGTTGLRTTIAEAVRYYIVPVLAGTVLSGSIIYRDFELPRPFVTVDADPYDGGESL